ncbi:hypothetical protein F4677DRAFT_277135 [Hypoxylon crocopeplum]|nr:hypothetical protein F4677DRAFT_277135 [Hypoxylon crocopeplum]
MRYIWIDTLCIVQDDPEDWDRESSQMEKVYGNADLVLAATVASSPYDGFLRDQDRTPSVGHVSVTMSPHATPIRSNYRLAAHKYEGDPLDGRAWAFQEMLLARRYLSYRSNEMTWKCVHDSFCQCGWSSCGRWDDRFNLASMKSMPYPSLAIDWKLKIVGIYARKELTRPSDKLIALSVVASRFHASWGGTYLAGLWKEDLIRDLLWAANYGEPEDFPVPSWASVRNGNIGYYLPIWTNHYRTVLAGILDASVTLSTTNRFGSVSGGFIKIRGKAIQAELCIDQQTSDRGDVHRLELPGFRSYGSPDTPLAAYDYILDPATGLTETSARRAFPIKDTSAAGSTCHEQCDPLIRYSIWVLPLAADMVSAKGIADIHTLVLGRSPKQRGCFERLGQFSIVKIGGSERPTKKVLAGYEDREFILV